MDGQGDTWMLGHWKKSVSKEVRERTNMQDVSAGDSLLLSIMGTAFSSVRNTRTVYHKLHARPAGALPGCGPQLPRSPAV